MDPVFHIQQPSAPELRFEWHPGVKRVYVIRVGFNPEVGEPIRDDVTDQGTALMTVLCWLRGYLAHKAWASPDVRLSSENVNGSHVAALG